MRATRIAVTTLGVSSVAGCTSDPIIGDWELDAFDSTASYDGYSYYDADCGNISVTYDEPQVTGDLFIDDDLRAELDLAISLGYAVSSDYCGNATGTLGPEEEQYDGDIAVLGDDEYVISLRGGDRSSFDCELRGDDRLDCVTTEDGVTSNLDFRRR